MLVKAVANATTASFIRVVGSEFVQKYLGEVRPRRSCVCLAQCLCDRIQGPRMVRDVFRMARENSPCIIFIDEVDAIATKRFDAQTGADREVQRILLELLNQMDGFDQGDNVKVSLVAHGGHSRFDLAIFRLLWRPTDKTPLIPLYFDLVVWTERSNSRSHPEENVD
jgi:26S proteasome regulatory subunit T3